MEFDIKPTLSVVECEDCDFGELDDIFGFYKYLVEKYSLTKHALLESSSANTNETLYSFIALKPDFMLEINGEHFKIFDITTARGECIKSYVE